MRRRALLVTALAGLLAAAPVAEAVAQPQRAARPIGKLIAEFEEPLTGPLRIVELRDGRLLVHDDGEKRLSIADFRSGELTAVSREGSGPTEYKSATVLLRAPGDSVWLYDILQSRVLILTPEGKPVRTELFVDGANMMAMLSRPMVREHDRAGNTYGELRHMSFEGGKMTMSDSVVLIRGRGRAASDTIAKMPSHMNAPEMSATAFRMRLPGFPAMDAWGVFPDGRILLVRGSTYTPEIHLPNGTRRSAAAIPYAKVPVTAADKKKLMDDTRKLFGEQMKRAMGGAPTGAQLPTFELLEPEPWQTHKPALSGTVISVDGSGRAWVHVLNASGDGARYDLLDAEGRLLDAVLLPKDSFLLGFGNGVAYITRKDADDLVYLQKVALP